MKTLYLTVLLLLYITASFCIAAELPENYKQFSPQTEAYRLTVRYARSLDKWISAFNTRYAGREKNPCGQTIEGYTVKCQEISGNYIFDIISNDPMELVLRIETSGKGVKGKSIYPNGHIVGETIPLENGRKFVVYYSTGELYSEMIQTTKKNYLDNCVYREYEKDGSVKSENLGCQGATAYIPY